MRIIRVPAASWMWLCDYRRHGGLTELNARLVESLQLYHTLMQELPSYSQPNYMSLSQVTTSIIWSMMTKVEIGG